MGVIKDDFNSCHRDILITTLLLSVVGLLMIYSASGSFELLKKQLLFVSLGLGVCLIVQCFDYKIFYKYAELIYLLSIGCIFLLLTPAGVSVNGATRWLRIAGVQFQVFTLLCEIAMTLSVARISADLVHFKRKCITKRRRGV